LLSIVRKCKLLPFQILYLRFRTYRFITLNILHIRWPKESLSKIFRHHQHDLFSKILHRKAISNNHKYLTSLLHNLHRKANSLGLVLLLPIQYFLNPHTNQIFWILITNKQDQMQINSNRRNKLCSKNHCNKLRVFPSSYWNFQYYQQVVFSRQYTLVNINMINKYQCHVNNIIINLD